jgi:hypothetical protein
MKNEVIDAFPAADYDAWKTTPDEEQESPCDGYHPGRCCDSRCDPDNDGDDYMDEDRTEEGW